MSPSKNKSCKACGETFNGRKNKIYCSKACANHYHNERHSIANHAFLKTEKILRNNFVIIDQAYPNLGSEKAITTKTIISRGYKLKFNTGYDQTSKSFLLYSYALKFDKHGNTFISKL